MIARQWRSLCVALGLAGCLPCLMPACAFAQRGPTSAKGDVALVVEGVVRQLFTGTQQRGNDALIEIEVRRAEARAAAPGSSRTRYPAPEESVYVHLSQPQDAGGRAPLSNKKPAMPSEGQTVRVFLKPRAAGGWQSASDDWFEVIQDAVASAPAEAPTSKPETQTTLGMTLETLKVENRTALRVTSIVRGGPAQTAGLEVGDVIAGINDAEIVKADELTALAALGEKFSLVVIDVNSGRAARVEMDPKLKPAEAAAADKPATPAPAAISLGMSAEAVTLGTRSALKVIRVDPAGIAAKAGLEPGDIVVAANGVATTSVEQLLSALRKSGPTLNLTVRDTRTGRDTEVAVGLGTNKPAASKEVETRVPQAPGKLGAVTELAFHDSDFAVKVTEVTPGSAAARAGLRAGMIIVAVDGKPVLHPNDLTEQVRKSAGTMKFAVVDPASGRKSNVDVSLGN